MSTPYSSVFEVFLEKITDMELPLMEDDTVREKILTRYMTNACSRFNKVCLVDLGDRSNETKEFNQELDDEIIDIITENMMVEWLRPKLLFTDNLSNKLNTKDFSHFSPANLLKEIRETYDLINKRARGMINNYSHSHSPIGKKKI